jgi:hypothetical protein
VTRSGSTAGTTTVDFATVPFRATSPQDFLDASGTLTFGPGDTARSFAVTVIGDTVAESLADRFDVRLGNAVNGTVVRDRATGAILDDDFNIVTVNRAAAAEDDPFRRGVHTVPAPGPGRHRGRPIPDDRRHGRGRASGLSPIGRQPNERGQVG